MVYTVKQSPSVANSGMGANLFADKSGASFRVWAPNASKVVLVLNGKEEFDLAKDNSNNEYYSIEVNGVKADDQYRYKITNNGVPPNNPGGDFDRTDSYARDVESSGNDAKAIVVDPNYTFTAFQTPYFENFIIYQLQIGSFAGFNDGIPVKDKTATFLDVIPKLDYIRDMGFNAIQFLPAGEYPGNSNEGYSPTDFFAPESAFGSPTDLRKLVDECHKRGLAVIFDVVYNHASGIDNHLWQYDGNTESNGGGIYFSNVQTGFGPMPNFDRRSVFNFFLDNARMFFREYNADGLRFDSAHNIHSAIFGGSGVLQELTGQIASEVPGKFLIAEFDNPTYAIKTFSFSSIWDFNGDGLIKLIQNGTVYALKDFIERWGYPHAFSTLRYLLGSHDQIFRNFKNGEKDDHAFNRYFVERVGGEFVGRNDWIARAKARLGWALNVTLPCTPMLFMGTECHHYGYWNPQNDDYGEHRFDWNIAGDEIGLGMRGLVRDANWLLWKNPALRSDKGPIFPHLDPQNRILAFKRWNDEGNVLLTVVNLSDNQWNDAIYAVSAGETSGSWEEIFNSQSPQYGGWQDSGNFGAVCKVGNDGCFGIRLPKWSVLVFRKR